MKGDVRDCSRRAKLPFTAVNRIGKPGYVSGLQRHHLLPRQLLSRTCFARLFDAMGDNRLAIEDFRKNGLLLPATEQAAINMRLPLHRGPHRLYNSVVETRVGQIEHDWSFRHARDGQKALQEAVMRLDLLQRGLRRRLLQSGRSQMVLNRSDPLGHGADFTALDAMAEALWAAAET